MKILQNKIAVGIIAVIVLAGGAYGTYGIVKYAERQNNVSVRSVNHATVLIEFNDTRIYIDPYNVSDYSKSKPADYIFITHDHADHYDPDSINAIIQDSTQIIAPASCSSIAAEYDIFGTVPGNNYTLDDIEFETIPMDTFNEAHPRSALYNGYVITINGFTFYHSGDTSKIPEMDNLAGRIDVAFIPIAGGCGSMTQLEASYAIGAIKPRYVVPIHSSENAENGGTDSFENTCGLTSPDTIVKFGTDWIILK